MTGKGDPSGLEARIRRPYYWRMAFLTLMMGASALLVYFVGARLRSRLALVGAIPFGWWVLNMVIDYRRGPKSFDREGVTRRDGKRFAWVDLKESRGVSGRYPWGQLTAPVYTDLQFAGGVVRVFPMVFENGGEIMRFLDDREKAPPRRRHETCGTCSTLRDYEIGAQKGGQEHLDTFLPPAAGALKVVKEINPGSRLPDLEVCPECGTYYLFETKYEYLVYGSEDEQILTRLTDEEARKYL